MIRSSVLVASVALVAGAQGCSSSSSDSGSSGGFISDYCGLVAPCCGKLGKPADGAQCRAILGALVSGNYDPNQGKACLDQMHAAQSDPTFCDAVLGTGSSKLSFPACQSVYASGGTAAPGATCTKTSDCAPSSEGKVTCASAFSGSTEIRKCQVQIAGKAGDSPCVGTVDGQLTSYDGSSTDVVPRGYLCNVADGLFCDSTSGKCTQQSDVGGPCTSSFGKDCVSDAYCDFTSKKCVARIATGSACSGGSDTCVVGDYCDSTSKTCTVKLADGSPCTDFSSCSSNNCVNSKCAPSSTIGEAFLCGGN